MRQEPQHASYCKPELFFYPKVLRALDQKEVGDMTCDTYSKLCMYNISQGSHEIYYVGHRMLKGLQPEGLFFIIHCGSI